jgi:hypothetical protein
MDLSVWLESFSALPFWGRNGPSLSGDLLLSMSDKRLTFCYIMIFMKDEIFPVNRDIDDQIDEFEAIGIV